MLVKKICGSKKFLRKKNFCVKKILGQKNFCVKKFVLFVLWPFRLLDLSSVFTMCWTFRPLDLAYFVPSVFCTKHPLYQVPFGPSVFCTMCLVPSVFGPSVFGPTVLEPKIEVPHFHFHAVPNSLLISLWQLTYFR